MATTKHSPGPWIVETIVGIPTGPYIIDGTGKVVGVLYGDNKNDGTLISAAPELLALLKKVLQAENRSPDDIKIGELSYEVADAIKKACGEEPADFL